MSNLKLNQVIALVKGAKAGAEGTFTEVYHRLQKASLTDGISRTYQPRDDDGETFPPESTKVQVRVIEQLAKAREPLAKLLDRLLTMDAGNQIANADIVTASGTVIATNVPVTMMLALEKRLVDFKTVISKLPVLDPALDWVVDGNNKGYKTEPVKTTKSKKVPRNHVKAEATDKHPAQVEVYYEDTIVGDWSTVRSSGAVSTAERDEYLRKIEELQEAVKTARETANMTEVPERKIGDAIFDHLGW